MIEFNYKPEGDILKQFLKDNSFFRGVRGPVGSGKSVACCIEILRRALQQEKDSKGIRKSRVAVVRNTNPQLRTTTIKTWLDWFPEKEWGKMNWSPPYTHHIKRGDIDLEVIFLALDRPDDVKKLLHILHKLVEEGNFRMDLFHRLNVFNIEISALNKRTEDIPTLIEYFSDKLLKNYNLKKFDLKPHINYLLNYNWPGNVRELRNLIERIAILQPDTKDKISNIIKESLKNINFDDQLAENSLSVPLKEAREKFEKEYLTIQLKKFNGNISKTANFVGMERSALHRKLKGLGIKEFN